MPTVNLTDAFIRNLKPNRQREDYRDDRLAGFGVRVSQGGTKTFVLVTVRTRTRQTIGRSDVITLAQARQKAKEILAAKTLGKDKPKTVTFQEAYDLFLET